MAERVADMPPMPGVGMATAEPREKPAISRRAGDAGARGRDGRLVPLRGRLGRHRLFPAAGPRGPDVDGRGLDGDLRLQRRDAAPVLAARPAEARDQSPLGAAHQAARAAADPPRQRSAQRRRTLPTFTLGALLDDTSPMPDDIIGPRVLTPGGLLVLGGAPKVGKSDLLIALLVHMAAGVPFLGFTPPRPLRIFYLQAEIQYHYLRERMQQIGLPRESDRRRARQPGRHAEAADAARRRGQRARGRGDQGRVPRRTARHPLRRPDPEPLRRRAGRRRRERQRRP
jgi:hypothetical protein